MFWQFGCMTVFNMNLLTLLLIDVRFLLIILLRRFYLKVYKFFGFHVVPMIVIALILRPLYQFCAKR